jgi:pilus assembly protein FimV
MAFGFGFNKQKVLSAAEKCVQQGKLPNAIAEYEKILKHDAKDLTVMNTIGDLYSRLGESEKAADCFKSVGDAYASQGFTVKAIAMYKKLSKLKASMESVLRLAELYTQQGLFNDARAQYLLVAEDFLKSGQLDQAVRIFEKTLEMDPDNVAMRTKLAEVYIRLGKKEDAWKILSAAAESLRGKGQLAAADEILQRMLKLEPNSGYVLALRGKAALDGGDAKAAIEALSKVSDLDTNPEGLRALFQAYLKTQKFDEASALATKLATVHNDSEAVREYAEALLEAEEYRDALNVYNEHADNLLRADPAKFSEALRTIIGHVREDAQALEIVLALFHKTGENTHISELYELLAHAYVQSGELEKARDCYAKLMQIEPANQMHARNHQQVLEKMGHSDTPRQITSEEGSSLIEELEATAPFIEQHYPDEVALAVRSALTDAELFMSYNSAPKALEPLMSALPKAPRDLRLNQKLASLHTKAGRFTEAAVCCRTLESIYHDAGHNEQAARYGELAAKYEQRSGLTISAAAPEMPATEFPIAAPADSATEFEISAPVESFQASEEKAAAPAATAAPKPPARSGIFFHRASTPSRVEPKPAEAAVSAPEPAAAAATAGPAEAATIDEAAVEVDISSEWDLSIEAPHAEPATIEVPEAAIEPQIQARAATTAEPVLAAAEQEVQAATEAAAAPDLSEGIEEVRFYLGQGMTEHAERVLAKFEELAPGSPELAVLRLGIDSAKQQLAAPAEPEVAIPEVAIEEAPAASVAEGSPVTTATPQPWPQEPPRKPAERPVLQEMVAELEESLGDGFLPQEKSEITAPAVQAPEVAPEMVAEPEPVEAEMQQFRSGSLDEFVSDLEASLGNDFLGDAPAPASAAALAPVRHSAPSAHFEAPPAQTAPMARAAAASAAYPAPQPPSPAVAPAAQSAAGVDLADMFGELKHELEDESAATDEDPETHYNLGVAFREMGLLDEAIGEFQKVCQSTERGRAFPQIMQTYTWLAQCFLDKGIPEAAIRWYEQALKIPNLDQETRTALHYELASSFETAGNKASALSNFLQVYGSNIDYRDVGERIKALRP